MPGSQRSARSGTALAVLFLVVGYTATAAWLVPRGLFLVTLHQRHPDRFHLVVPVPAPVVEAVCFVAGSFFADSMRLHVGEELSSLRPLAQEAVGELADLPDAVLVQVESGGDRVRVTKHRGALVVEVEQPDLSLRVSAPTGATRRAVAWILG